MRIFTKLANKIFITKFNATHQAERKKNLEKSPQKENDTLAFTTNSSILQSSPFSPILNVPRQTVHFAEEPSKDVFTPSNLPLAVRFNEVKKDVLEGLERSYVSSEVTSRLSCLLKEKPHNIEILTLRAIAHRLREEMTQCAEDCNLILALDPKNRFALLHRLSTASSHVLKPHQKVSTYVEYFRAAREYAESATNDRLCLFIKTIWLGNYPGSFEILTELRYLYLVNPEDIYMGTVLMSAILSRREMQIDGQEMRDIKMNAEILLMYDKNNVLAHQVLYVYFRVPISYCAESTTADFTCNFADFPLRHLDDKLPMLIENLTVQ